MPVKSKEEYERTIRNTLGSAKQAMTLFRNMIQVQFKEYCENYGASDMALAKDVFLFQIHDMMHDDLLYTLKEVANHLSLRREADIMKIIESSPFFLLYSNECIVRSHRNITFMKKIYPKGMTFEVLLLFFLMIGGQEMHSSYHFSL